MGLEAFLLAVGGGLYMREYEPSWVEIKEVNLKLPRLGRSFSGLRIVQISDLHFGGWMTTEYLIDILQKVLDLSPDLAVITGDFVMGYDNHYEPHIIENLGQLAAALKMLSGHVPTLGVLGNHDYWFNHTSIRQMLRQAGVLELNNSVHTLERSREVLHLAGVDDVMERHARLDQVLSRLPDEGCAILLAHEPDFADISARTGRFDLQLSGHSHGGQVVLPLIGPPVLPYLAQEIPLGSL